jgi:hypothetical protein
MAALVSSSRRAVQQWNCLPCSTRQHTRRHHFANSNAQQRLQQHPCTAVQGHSSTSRRRQHLAAAALAGPPSATAPPPEAPPAGTSAAPAGSTGAAGAAAAAAAVADPCLELHGVQARAVGAVLGSMCGNALGAQVEPEKHYRLTRLFPEGLQVCEAEAAAGAAAGPAERRNYNAHGCLHVHVLQ